MKLIVRFKWNFFGREQKVLCLFLKNDRQVVGEALTVFNSLPIFKARVSKITAFKALPLKFAMEAFAWLEVETVLLLEVTSKERMM